MIYLDHAATTPLDPRVRGAMEPWLATEFGNPSSRHRSGVRAAAAVDAARAEVARAVGARKHGVVFTAGGTEANNLATLGFARAHARLGRHVLCGPMEHASVRESCRALVDEGFEVEWMRLDASGALDVAHATAHMRPDTVLITLMLVQNELGNVFPVRAIARAARARSPKACVHADLVQALGKLPISMNELEVDSIAISAHKIQGPKGVGALVLAGDVEPRPLVFGGGQEDGRRAGTENVASIVGFGAACSIAERERVDTARRTHELRARLVAGLVNAPGTRVLEPGSGPLATDVDATTSAGTNHARGGSGRAWVPSIVALYVPGAPAEVRMHHIEERGVVVSAGSACQSRKGDASPALLALGLSPEDARRVLRVSFGPTTTLEHVETFVDALVVTISKLDATGKGH